MESDLSLIEFSGEDDSLLQQIPNDDVSSFNRNCFLCSPLQIPRSKRSASPSLVSPSEGMMGNEDAGKQSSSSHRDDVNKEYMNKSELPKLSVEPQQMKRKKKGGGYNLRKSLAWDRAFFTEEGVLDPLELSIISGNFSKPGGEMLSVIHEESGESLSGVLECSSDSENLQALEENLFKELPVSTVNEDRKIGDGLLAKIDSSVRDNAAKRKVLSPKDNNRCGSKRGGCPRPVVSSSLKRPANANTTKAATEESKVSKIPIPKPNPRVLSSTAKSVIPGAGLSKRSQIAQPAVSVQKTVGLKGSSNNTSNFLNDAKSGPTSKSLTGKPSVRQARRNVVSSASEIHSSTHLHHPPVNKANNGLKVNLDPVLPAADHASRHDGNSGKNAVTRPQNNHYIGGNIQYAPLPTAKPSGLRMPSPSLGFFAQSKASDSHGLSQTSTQPCDLPKSNIPYLRKPGVVNHIRKRPPAISGKIPEVVNNVASGYTRVSGSSTRCSVSSAVNPTSHEMTKSNLGISNMQKVDATVPYHSNSHEMINNNQQLHSVHDLDEQSSEHAESYKTKPVSHVEDKKLQSNDKGLLLESGPCEQLKKDDGNERITYTCPKSLSEAELKNPHLTSHLSPTVQVEVVSGTNDMIDNQYVEDKQYNSSIRNQGVSSESQSADNNSCNTQGTSKVHMLNDGLSSMHVNEQSGKQADLMKPFTCEVDQIASEESQRLWRSDGTLFMKSGFSEEFQIYNSAKISDISPKLQDCSAIELERSQGLCHSKEIRQANYSDTGVDNLRRRSQVGDAQVQSLDGNPSVESDNGILISSVLGNQHLMVVDGVNRNLEEQPEVPNTFVVGGQVLQDNYGSDLNDCLVQGKIFSSEESRHGNVLHSVKSFVPEETAACISELKSSQALCSMPPATQDFGLEVAEMVECLHVDDALSGSVDKIHGKATSWELDRMDKYQITGAVTTCNIEDTTVFPNSGDFSGSKLENPHFTTHLSPVVQIKGGSRIDDMVEHKGPEDKCKFSVNDYKAISDLQPGDDSSYCHQGTLIVHDDWSCGMPDVSEKSIEQAKLIKSCSCEADKISREENQSTEACYGPLFEEGKSFEELRKFNTGNVTDVNMKVQDSGGRGLENPNGLSQHEHIELAKEEVAEVTNVIKKSLAEDAQMLVSDVNEQPREHPDLQTPSLVVEQVSLNLDDLANNISSKELLVVNVPRSVSDVVLEQSDAYGSELKSPIVWTQESLAMHNGDVAEVNNLIKKSLAEDAQMQSLDGSLLVDCSNNDLITSLVNIESSVLISDVNEQPGEHPEFQTPSLVVEQVSLDLDDLANNISSDELLEANVPRSVSDVVSEQFDACGSELKSSIVWTQESLAMHNVDVDVDKKAEYQPKEDTMSGSSEIELSASSLGVNLSLRSEDKLSGAVDTCSSNAFCSSNTYQTLSSGSALLVDVNVLKSSVFPEEAETNISENSGSLNTEMQHVLQSTYPTEEKNATISLKKSGSDKKHDALVIKPPPNVVPFSDEWLAALEAAGEEILTKKSGAVQNSPPDKSLPELGPWSPVKRKNNQGFGPFDCTKFTNPNIPPSGSS